MARWSRYVALGDSITEGFCDPIIGTGEPWLGWADRLAFILDGHARLQGRRLEFANLAVRGRRVHDVVAEQVPQALELGADLVSILIGGNDLLAPTADPDAVSAELEIGVIALRDAGVDVLLATCFDPQVAFFMRPFRGRAAVYNGNLWSIARRHGTATLDVWGMRELQRRSMWAADRIHLSPDGHRLLASRAAHALGVPYFEVRATAAALPADELGTLGWLQQHALPWVGRRLRRVSSGDGIPPKLPNPIPLGPEGHTGRR